MSITNEITECKVSSVLNNDRKLFGRKNLFDGNDETCWNSDQGSPQWIEFGFRIPRSITKLKLQFQGGFVGKNCELETLGPSNLNQNELEGLVKFNFDPLDTNSMQEFHLDEPMSSQNFRLIFRSSTDFYGRIILYHFDIIGNQ